MTAWNLCAAWISSHLHKHRLQSWSCYGQLRDNPVTSSQRRLAWAPKILALFDENQLSSPSQGHEESSGHLGMFKRVREYQTKSVVKSSPSSTRWSRSSKCDPILHTSPRALHSRVNTLHTHHLPACLHVTRFPREIKKKWKKKA